MNLGRPKQERERNEHLFRNSCVGESSHKVVVLGQFWLKSCGCQQFYSPAPCNPTVACSTTHSLSLIHRPTGELESFLQEQETLLFFCGIQFLQVLQAEQAHCRIWWSRCQLQQRNLYHSKDSKDLNSLNCQDSPVFRLGFSTVGWVFSFVHLQLNGHYASPASNFVKTNQSDWFLFLQLLSFWPMQVIHSLRASTLSG